ncbi:MAG: hypothetical protein Q9224_007096, partial [Gallowayella concinna]
MKKIANQFEGYVNLGGPLADAFHDIKNNLPWFNASVHKLLVSAIQAIWGSYTIRLMCWSAIARRARQRDDVSAYNQAQFEAITLLSGVVEAITTLQKGTTDKIADMKSTRVAGVKVIPTTQ